MALFSTRTKQSIGRAGEVLAGAHRWLPGDLGPRLPPFPILLEVRFRFLERGCPPLGSHASARVDDGDCPAPSEFVARTGGWVFIEAADRAAVLKDSVVFFVVDRRRAAGPSCEGLVPFCVLDSRVGLA